MDFKIAVLAGDGIGPEISTVGVDVMTAVCEKFGHKVNYEYAICGADAIDKGGDPFPEATYEACKNADAVLFSAVGEPKFEMTLLKKCVPSRACWLCARNWDCLPTSVPCRPSNVCSISLPFVRNWWMVPISFASAN